ncbi:unnamed protein product [Ascophyllum nodosum]
MLIRKTYDISDSLSCQATAYSYKYSLFVLPVTRSKSSVGHSFASGPVTPTRVRETIRMSAGGEASWDAAAGIWVGDRAAGCDGDVPSPLWIFGYGSLCWRPEKSFEGFDKFDGEVEGWKRLFAQKSMDHRGTPQSPGLVATLISDADLEALGKRSLGDPPSKTRGVAYLIPDNRADAVLAALDFREKGGYTRSVVNVFRSNDVSTKGDNIGQGDMDDNAPRDGRRVPAPDTPVGERGAPTKALLYTATIDNPNFHLSPTAEEAADVIASAVGPSGPNHEYLFLLSEYLQQIGHPDAELEELSSMVRSRLAKS